jgi:uncharacterized protein (DUF2147 family)
MRSPLKNPVEGRWYTIDEDTGRPGSVIRISVVGGRLHGRIDELIRLDPGPPPRCVHCDGDRKDKPFLGLTILWGLEPSEDGWRDGEILDPTTGTVYQCDVRLVEWDTLEVRGYLGVPLLGRTLSWKRVGAHSVR